MFASGDVVVAGAGPAGAIAALRLSRAGARVTMLDRLQPAASRIGEVLPGAAARLLAMLDLERVLDPIEGAVLSRVGGRLSAWGEPVPILEDALGDPYGIGSRLDRLLFDQVLRRCAVEAGAQQLHANVRDIEREGQNWVCRLDNGSDLGCRWLIDATGRKARIGKLLGARQHHTAPMLSLYRTILPTTNNDFDRTIIEAVIDGWFYAGRLGGARWAIGFHTLPREATFIRKTPQDFRDRLRSAPMLSSMLGRYEEEGPLIARDARSAWLDPCMGSGWIACGDAALSFDPIAGQGLFNAIRTGMAAADELIRRANGMAEIEYENEVNAVAAAYLRRRRALYLNETRWMDAPFWQSQRL